MTRAKRIDMAAMAAEVAAAAGFPDPEPSPPVACPKCREPMPAAELPDHYAATHRHARREAVTAKRGPKPGTPAPQLGD